MATALRQAADQLLDGIPTATAIETPLDAETSEDAQVLTCATCGHQMAWNGPAILQHGPDGAHALDTRFN
jgi:hypothetical protein